MSYKYEHSMSLLRAGFCAACICFFSCWVLQCIQLPHFGFPLLWMLAFGCFLSHEKVLLWIFHRSYLVWLLNSLMSGWPRTYYIIQDWTPGPPASIPSCLLESRTAISGSHGNHCLLVWETARLFLQNGCIILHHQQQCLIMLLCYNLPTLVITYGEEV